MNTTRVTRVEVIDHTRSWEEGGGRVYVLKKEDIHVEVQLQDNDRTLKVFISSK